jgi:hypothetical protein
MSKEYGIGLISLEWSFSQKCFHIDDMATIIRENRSMILKGGSTDYVLIGLFANEEDASAIADKLRMEMSRSGRSDVIREMNLEIDRLLEENRRLKEAL